MAAGVSRNRLGARRTVSIAVGLLVVVAVTIATISGRDQTGSRTAADVVTNRSPLIGHRAPVFDVHGLTLRRIRTADFPGRVLVVNFWASWCVPCRSANLEATSEHWRSRGVTVVRIAWHDLPVDANGFRRAHHLTSPHGIDENETAGPAYGVVALPATFVITATAVTARMNRGRTILISNQRRVVLPTRSRTSATDANAASTKTPGLYPKAPRTSPRAAARTARVIPHSGSIMPRWCNGVCRSKGARPKIARPAAAVTPAIATRVNPA